MLQQISSAGIHYSQEKNEFRYSIAWPPTNPATNWWCKVWVFGGGEYDFPSTIHEIEWSQFKIYCFDEQVSFQSMQDFYTTLWGRYLEFQKLVGISTVPLAFIPSIVEGISMWQALGAAGAVWGRGWGACFACCSMYLVQRNRLSLFVRRRWTKIG